MTEKSDVRPDTTAYRRSLREILSVVDALARDGHHQYWLAYGTTLGAMREGDLIPWDFDIDIYVTAGSIHAFAQELRRGLPDAYQLLEPTKSEGYEQLFPRVTRRGINHNLLHLDIFPLCGMPSARIARRPFRAAIRCAVKGYKYKVLTPRERYAHDRRRWALAWLAKAVLLPVPARLFSSAYNSLSALWPTDEARELLSPCSIYGRREIMPKRFFATGEYGRIGDQWFPVPSNTDDYLKHIYGDWARRPPLTEQERQIRFFEAVIWPQFAGTIEDDVS